MPCISVIVPVYQAEATIRRCVNSILSQTHTDLELILVDDGSTDRSGNICDECAAADNRIHVVHKENAGVSAARNSGLDIAQGDFVTFIDSDDFVGSQYLENLLTPDADLTMCGLSVISETGVESPLLSPSDDVYPTNPQTIADWFDNNYLKYVCGKLFRRGIIESHKMRFDARISLGEDSVFVTEFAMYCNRFASVSAILYYYDKHPANTLTKQITHKSVISNNLRDCLLNKMLTENNIPSKIFHTAAYVSKFKMKHAFLSVFENAEINIFKKFKWYRLFFKLPLFVDHMDIMTEGLSPNLARTIKRKSATLLIAFQVLARIKNAVKKGTKS